MSKVTQHIAILARKQHVIAVPMQASCSDGLSGGGGSGGSGEESC